MGEFDGTVYAETLTPPPLPNGEEMITQEEYNRGGYAKYRLTKEYIDHAKSRAVDGKGRVFTGSSGKALLERQKREEQAQHRTPLLTSYT
jgi:hypothetical protein